MTDKELIKQEIERRINHFKGKVITSYTNWWIDAYEELLQFIDSLQEQPISEDWEEAAKQHSKQTFNGILIEDNIDAFKAGAEWQKHQMKETLQTEYEKGRFDMREEMMKDAVEAEVMYPASSSTLQIRYKLPKNTKLKLGDKVKIIICKTEQQ